MSVSDYSLVIRYCCCIVGMWIKSQVQSSVSSPGTLFSRKDDQEWSGEKEGVLICSGEIS